MIKKIEIYKNGENWVITWEDDAKNPIQRSQKFPSKEQANEFKEKLESYYNYEQETLAY